jgi:alpha-glucosidase
MEAGVFFPILRSHSHLDSTPRFPWLFGHAVENGIRKTLNLRYRLIPYYYSLAFGNTMTAAPLMRPLVMEFPSDDKVSGMTDEWLMGNGLLAAPVMSQGGSRDIYLPKDLWYRLGTADSIQGPQTLHVTSKLDEIPVYVRAGTLLPLGPVVQHTGESNSAPLELQIYPGRDASFDLIQDDGQTLNYRKGDVRRISFCWNDRTKTLSWRITGSYNGKNCFRKLKGVLFSKRRGITRNLPLGNEGSVSFPSN